MTRKSFLARTVPVILIVSLMVFVITVMSSYDVLWWIVKDAP